MILQTRLSNSTWHRYVTVGQAFGSAILTAEAVHAHRPEIFFDTVGYAFGYPVACLSGAKVAAYVHYPTISTAGICVHH